MAGRYLESRQECLTESIQATERQVLIDGCSIARYDPILVTVHDGNKFISGRFHTNVFARIAFVKEVPNKCCFTLRFSDYKQYCLCVLSLSYLLLCFSVFFPVSLSALSPSLLTGIQFDVPWNTVQSVKLWALLQYPSLWAAQSGSLTRALDRSLHTLPQWHNLTFKIVGHFERLDFCLVNLFDTLNNLRILVLAPVLRWWVGCGPYRSTVARATVSFR